MVNFFSYLSTRRIHKKRRYLMTVIQMMTSVNVSMTTVIHQTMKNMPMVEQREKHWSGMTPRYHIKTFTMKETWFKDTVKYLYS